MFYKGKWSLKLIFSICGALQGAIFCPNRSKNIKICFETVILEEDFFCRNDDFRRRFFSDFRRQLLADLAVSSKRPDHNLVVNFAEGARSVKVSE